MTSNEIEVLKEDFERHNSEMDRLIRIASKIILSDDLKSWQIPVLPLIKEDIITSCEAEQWTEEQRRSGALQYENISDKVHEMLAYHTTSQEIVKAAFPKYRLFCEYFLAELVRLQKAEAQTVPQWRREALKCDFLKLYENHRRMIRDSLTAEDSAAVKKTSTTQRKKAKEPRTPKKVEEIITRLARRDEKPKELWGSFIGELDSEQMQPKECTTQAGAVQVIYLNPKDDKERHLTLKRFAEMIHKKRKNTN